MIKYFKKDFWKKTIKYEYYMSKSDIKFRDGGDGGMRVAITSVKTVTRRGKSKKYSRKTIFSNYHNRAGSFMFCPASEPDYYTTYNGKYGDGYEFLCYELCEKYKFAPMKTEWIHKWVDEELGVDEDDPWGYDPNKLQWYEKIDLY